MLAYKSFQRPVIHNDLYSSLLFDIKNTELIYSQQLMKLLACCTPLKSPTKPSTTIRTNDNTKVIRKLIALHSELGRVLSGGDASVCIKGFIDWCGMAAKVYELYTNQYALSLDLLDLEIKLLKMPLKRVIELSKSIKKVMELSGGAAGGLNVGYVSEKFEKLVESAKDKNEVENTYLDLNTFYFDDVRDLEKFEKCVDYFTLKQIIKRDYFNFDIKHPLYEKRLLVEVFQLKNSIAICSIESVGRSLMFPLLRLEEFELSVRDNQVILVKGVLEMRFECDDHQQFSEWVPLFEELNRISGFIETYHNLEKLKNEKIGLGLKLNELRRSSPMVVKHDSLPPSSPILQEISNNSPAQSIYKELNESTVSLPVINSTPLTKAEFASTTDLSTTTKNKSKKRKSIFNLFKKTSEPEFEIVTKETLSSSSSTNSINKPALSMAALNRNVKNLSINTSVTTTTKNPSSSFASSAIVAEIAQEELEIIKSCTVIKVFTNSVIISKWNLNKWEVIGQEYQNQLKFLQFEDSLFLSLYINSQPSLLLPITTKAMRKASALDLQIRCFSSIDLKDMIMLNIRCRDSKTIYSIMNSFEMESVSSSASDVSSERPSASTSMSSISGEMCFMKPMINLSTSTISTSTSTLNTPTETPTTPLNELLLRNNVRIKLHQKDKDGDWMPISIGKMGLYSNVSNPEYSKFDIHCLNKVRLTTTIKNSQCQRIGKSGLEFVSIDENGDEVNYLLELRNPTECHELYELLQ